MPQQGILRSSCDGCGAAKVKCDRGHPSCGRCISLDQTCFYGLSRKLGKRARNTASLIGIDAGNTRREQERVSRESGIFQRDSYGHNLEFPTDGMMGQGADAIFNNQLLNFYPDFTAPDTGEASTCWSRMNSLNMEEPSLLNDESGSAFTLSFSESETRPSSVLRRHESQPPTEPGTHLYSIQPDQREGHDCFQDAYDILGGLFFHRINKTQSQANASPTANASESHVALDHLLGANKEACKALHHILHCTCTRSPQLTLLCASIISRILLWYQQAAASIRSGDTSLVDEATVSAREARSLQSRPGIVDSISGSRSSRWSSAASSMYNSATLGTTVRDRVTQTRIVGPANMAIGDFNIENRRVRTILQIHLLLDEVRKLGKLINRLTSQDLNEHNERADYVTRAAHDLYEGLDTWLRGEHARIISMTKAELTNIHP